MSKVESNAGWGVTWPAPAKLNLMLRIVGRRADGYHLLQTVFQFIDLIDGLQFHPRSNREVILRNPIAGVLPQDDLTVKAAVALQHYTGCEQGVEIVLDKHIPMGGGLGGGSSDAATTLVVLNHLWGLGLTQQELMKIGLNLGADVPIFVFGSSAWAEGVGEQISAIDLPEMWMLVIKPECHVNTKEIFCAKELTRDSKRITIGDFRAGQRDNDCLAVVEKFYQPVREAINDLSRYSLARLTGTGACVYAEFASQEEAEAARDALSTKWNVYLAKSMNKSPLYSMLEQ